MAVSVLYSYTDAKGQSSTQEIHLDDALSMAQMTGYAQALATLLNAVTTGVITRVGIVVSVTLPGGLRVAALTNSDVEEGAKFQFNTASNFRTGFRIPTFNEDLIASNSRAVDLEDADVAAMVAGIVSGLTIGGTVVSPTDARESDITALISAKEQFLSSRA